MHEAASPADDAFAPAERRRIAVLLSVATGGFFLLTACWYLWPGFFARPLLHTPVTLAMASAFADLVIIIAALAGYARQHGRAGGNSRHC